MSPLRIPAASTESPDSETGQLMVLIIGYVLLSLLLVTVVSAASSIYVEHKKLLSAADGAAMAAADSFTLAQLGGTTAAPSASLGAAQVRAAAAKYLTDTQAANVFSRLELAAGTGSTDGHSAQVTLNAVAHPWFVNFLVPGGIPINASSTARAQLQR